MKLAGRGIMMGFGFVYIKVEESMMMMMMMMTIDNHPSNHQRGETINQLTRSYPLIR